MKTEMRLPALLLAAWLLVGCGLKGGLYLPEPETPVAESAAPEASASTSAGDDQESSVQREQRGD